MYNGHMKTVTISRKRWTRGGAGALRTESGQSCCLGFVARAYGLRTPTNSSVFADLPACNQDISCLPKKLQPTKEANGTWSDSSLHDKLTEANDDVFGAVGKAREAKITKLLAKAGIKAIFED
jgi:hypothetical protein